MDNSPNRDRQKNDERSQSDYEKLTNEISTLIWRSGPDKLCDYFNESWLRFTGRTLEQELGNAWTEGVHHEDLERCLEIYNRAFDRREPFSMEYRLRHADGSYRWILDDGGPIYDAKGEFLGYVGAATDITSLKNVQGEMGREIAERKSAERALRKSEELFRMLFDNMRAGVAIYEAVDGGEDFLFVNMNAAGLSMGKKDLSEIRGRRVTEVFPAVREIGLLDVFRRVWHTRKSEELPLTQYDDGTAAHWAENFVFTLPSGLLVSMYEDTSEKARMEEHLRQAQKMEAIGQLTGGVAHDFNNLLQVINGGTDMAMLDLESDHPARESLVEVAAAGERAARLVSQLLLFSRRQIMRPETLDLNEAISDLIAMLRRLIGENIQLRWQPGGILETIYADRGMIEQVLINLCINARDAMPGGGTLDIRTSEVEVGEACCSSRSWARPGRYHLLEVQDTGCGMDQKTLQRLFEPFFTTKEKGKGTGLGLATVYGIVKQHEGMIDVVSELAQGTTFQLYWPAADVQVRSEDPVKSRAGEIDGKGERILLAEDDPMVRKLACTILERAGYTVWTAADGDEAVRLFEEKKDKVDLAILDVVMPNLSGHKAYQKMQQKRPDLKVLFASGYGEEVAGNNLILEEGLQMIQKPYPRKDLLRRVRSILEAEDAEA